MPTLQERTLAAVSQLEADADIQHEVSNGGPAVTVTTESGQVRTVANAIATLMATVPRGAWLATTVYASKDLVTQSNVVYICTIPHTAGVFATDVAAGKWAMFSGPADEGSIASGFGRQRRRGTTAQHAAFTGLAGELTVDINKKTLVVHDGLTAGGLPIARQFEINLKEFGALGDGATDDTAAIQSAFDFALASGIRRVRIPSGTYMAEGLHIKSQVEVMGEGRTHSMIKAITAASTILTLDANTYPVCLCKFALIGDAKAQYGLVAENYSLVQGRLIEFEVSGCTNGNGYGFSNSGSMLSCLMDGVYFVGNKVGAIIVGLANNILITNSFIYGNSSKNLKIATGRLPVQWFQLSTPILRTWAGWEATWCAAR